LRGNRCKQFEIGDEVYSRVPQEQMGTIAEFVSINSELVAKKNPKNSSFEEAAGLPLTGLTAQALRMLALKRTIEFLFMQVLV
jgi:NADPH:quinone reductase-like Zn-dependent oxidoreductase